MIDIHCHIIPGVDDGSPDFETSGAMAEIAVKSGIKAIIATPHITEVLSLKKVYESGIKLQQFIYKKGLDLKLYTGGEIPFRLLEEGRNLVTLGGSSFMLIEFLPGYVPANAADVFRSYVKKGFKLIIAHPERNIVFMKNPHTLFDLLMPGVYTQVTGMSLKGSFGTSIKIFAGELLKHNKVDFIASDAHDCKYRTPELKSLLFSGKNKKYLSRLEKILTQNPEMIDFHGSQ